jgi:DNA polymerase III subunit alpha
MEGFLVALTHEQLKWRATLNKNIHRLVAYGENCAAHKKSGQVDMFRDVEHLPLVLQESDTWTQEEAMAKEFDAFGFYFSGHPLDALFDALDAYNERKSNGGSV